MEHIAVEARQRASQMSKGERKQLRLQGLILGSVYGKGLDAVAVTIPAADLARVFASEGGMNTLVDLKLDGKRHLVRVSTLATDPITRKTIHVGLQKINARDPQKASIPVELVGEPEAVSTNAALLEIANETIDIRCLPEDLIPSFTVDISEMQLGDVKRVGDVEIPEKLELLSDPDAALVSVRPKPTLEVDEPTEATEPAESSESAQDEVQATTDEASAGSE